MNGPDAVRGRPVPEAYANALHRPCPSCGAEPGEYCLVHDDRDGPRVRRAPCVRRYPRTEPPYTDEPDARPARPSRSFSEPLRGQHDDDDEVHR